MSGQVALAVLNGLASGMAVFLVATGLTLIFGTLRVLNFAHGGFFMLGAYVAGTLAGTGGGSVAGYLGAAVAAGLVVAALGLVVERAILRRLRRVDEAYMLIATFALLLVCQGAAKLIWGLDVRSVEPPLGLDGALLLGGLVLPSLSLFIILAGVLLFVVLELGLRRTRVGRSLQAIAADPWMAQALGVNVPLVFGGVVVISFFLAGFAGGLLLPNQSLSPELAGSYVLQAFVVIIVGGVGSVRGAFVAAVLIAVIDSLAALAAPNYPGAAISLTMILALLIRPQGLFGEARL